MTQATWFQRYLLPGFAFNAFVIGGGYATGRELVEFFLSNGPLGGLLGLLTTMVLISLIAAIGFEFARLACRYDYRSFFRALLGRGWFLWEVAYFPTVLLVLAVLGAASGEMVATHFGIEPAIGIIGLMLLIGIGPTIYMWKTPAWELWPWIVAMGVLSSLATQGVTRSLVVADASLVMPFNFLKLPFAIVLGLTFWAELPDLWTCIGATVIFASTYYIARREAAAKTG